MKKLIGYAGKDRHEHDRSGGPVDRRSQRVAPSVVEVSETGKIPSAARRNRILTRHRNGDSHVDIARDYGISRERVRQIVAAAGGIPRRGKQRPRAIKP